MEPIDFPFAHRSVVRNIVADVKRLSDESLAADKDIHDIKRASKALAEKYKNNITAVAELPAGVEAFAEVPSSRWMSLPASSDCQFNSVSMFFFWQRVTAHRVGLAVSLVKWLTVLSIFPPFQNSAIWILDFDETVTGAIEAIKTQKNLDDAILELKEIAKVWSVFIRFGSMPNGFL